MGNIDEAFGFFETNFYDYNDPSVPIDDPVASKHLEAIISEGTKLDVAQFKQLPLGIRIHVLAKINSTDIGHYLDAQIANYIVVAKPNASLVQASVGYLSSWDEDSSSLKLEGMALNGQENAELLIDLLPDAVKYQMKSLDLTKCVSIVNLEKILSSIKAPTLLKINELYLLKSLKGIENLADCLEELQAKDLFVLKSVESLSACSKLKKIDLNNAKILDDIRPLQTLDLEELSIGGCYQLKFLGEIMPKFSHLKRLNISNNPFFNDLSILLECRDLEYLDISHTAVEDVKPLHALKKLKSENIKVRGCKLKTL
ncbi:MAG: hypothetical protein Q8K75_11400 [Chlamydiales bacterium]|nr:hypothetical protein [Chlamydiales bacterium]